MAKNSQVRMAIPNPLIRFSYCKLIHRARAEKISDNKTPEVNSVPAVQYIPSQREGQELQDLSTG